MADVHGIKLGLLPKAVALDVRLGPAPYIAFVVVDRLVDRVQP